MERRLCAVSHDCNQADVLGVKGPSGHVMALVAAIAALSAVACGDEAANKNAAGCPEGQLASDAGCMPSEANNNVEGNNAVAQNNSTNNSEVPLITCGPGTHLEGNVCLPDRDGNGNGQSCVNVAYCPEGFADEFVEENPLDVTKKNTVCVPSLFEEICAEGAVAQCDLPECEDAREVCSAVPVVTTPEGGVVLPMDTTQGLCRSVADVCPEPVVFARLEAGDLPVCRNSFRICSDLPDCEPFEAPVAIVGLQVLNDGETCVDFKQRTDLILGQFGYELAFQFPCDAGSAPVVEVLCSLHGADLPADYRVTVVDGSGGNPVTIKITTDYGERLTPACTP
jgi:hypothetical protein